MDSFDMAKAAGCFGVQEELERWKDLAEERGREVERLKAEERYWRHEIVTTRLCPVDHKQPHVSHDCVTEIEHRWKDAEARLAQVVEDFRWTVERVEQEAWCQDCGVGQEDHQPMLSFKAKLGAALAAVQPKG